MQESLCSICKTRNACYFRKPLDERARTLAAFYFSRLMYFYRLEMTGLMFRYTNMKREDTFCFNKNRRLGLIHDNIGQSHEDLFGKAVRDMDHGSRSPKSMR
jgi:hypothetical protein